MEINTLYKSDVRVFFCMPALSFLVLPVFGPYLAYIENFKSGNLKSEIVKCARGARVIADGGSTSILDKVFRGGNITHYPNAEEPNGASGICKFRF